MSNDPFKPLTGSQKKAQTKPVAGWGPVTPVPENAPPPPKTHFKRGTPVLSHEYLDEKSRLLGFMWRLDDGQGGKEFVYLTYCKHSETGEMAWRFKSWPVPRPLFGLNHLAESPKALVIICEGEKAVDAAHILLPDFIAISSCGGSNAAPKADWQALKGRKVIIWPDADKPGLKYAEAVVQELKKVGAASVAVITPQDGVAEGWDAADALAEKWNEKRALKLIETARAASEAMQNTHDVTGRAPSGIGRNNSSEQEGESQSSGRKRGPAQRDSMIGMCDSCEFWHDAGGSVYVTMPVNSHLEHWPIRSREFRRWLARQYYEAHNGAVGGQALEDSLRVLEARGAHNGACYSPFRRIGRNGDALYIDLCDSEWRAVEVTTCGWSVVNRSSIKFLRSGSQRELPAPERGGMIEELREFINIACDEDFKLIVAWLVAALRDKGPYPILILGGEQGSGKSGLTRLIRSIVDPNGAPVRSVPKDERDLVVMAFNSHICALDNLSGVANWLSDGLCRLATGGGFGTRALHTDNDETIFESQKPIILNGIDELAKRADLADRAISVFLPRIPEDKRKPEDQFWSEFRAAQPRILGALFDAVSAALRHLPETRLEKLPRMADFAKWVTAAEPGLGWEPGKFIEAYEANRHNVAETAFEADPVAVAIRDVIPRVCPDGFDGNATELLKLLNENTSDGTRKNRSWPGSASVMGSRLRRVAPLLRQTGFAVDQGHSGERYVRIWLQGH